MRENEAVVAPFPTKLKGHIYLVIYDTEGRELMGLGVNGKMEGVGEGTRGYVNIDVGERKR